MLRSLFILTLTILYINTKSYHYNWLSSFENLCPKETYLTLRTNKYKSTYVNDRKLKNIILSCLTEQHRLYGLYIRRLKKLTTFCICKWFLKSSHLIYNKFCIQYNWSTDLPDQILRYLIGCPLSFQKRDGAEGGVYKLKVYMTCPLNLNYSFRYSFSLWNEKWRKWSFIFCKNHCPIRSSTFMPTHKIRKCLN